LPFGATVIDGSGSTNASIGDWTAKRSADFKLEVEELTAGDTWSSASLLSSTTETKTGLPYYPLWHSKVPLLESMFMTKYPVDSETQEDGFRYIHKDGMLYPSDFKIIYPFRIDVKVTQANPRTPYRAKLTYETTNNTSSPNDTPTEAFYTIVLSTAYYTRAQI